MTLSGGGYTSSNGTLTGGSYTFNISANSLSVGTDTLTASYAGDGNYITGTGTETVNVTSAQTIALSPSQPSPVVAGGSSSATITVNSITGYAGTVTLTCTLTHTPPNAIDPPTWAAASGYTVIQHVLVEAAKLAPRLNHDLALIYEKEMQRGM